MLITTGREILLNAGKVKLMRVVDDAMFWTAANWITLYPVGFPMMDKESEGMKSPKIYLVLSSRPRKVRVSVQATQRKPPSYILSDNIVELIDLASFTLLGFIH